LGSQEGSEERKQEDPKAQLGQLKPTGSCKIRVLSVRLGSCEWICSSERNGTANSVIGDGNGVSTNSFLQSEFGGG
jgi:hypothetical protein